MTGWRFGPGQSAFGVVVGPDGSILFTTTPFTDNPLQPTATDMEIGVLDPDATRFDLIVVHSTTGRALLPSGGSGSTGGGDVAQLAAVPGSSPPQMLFVSTSPYHGWPVQSFGELPSVGRLKLTNGGWQFDSAGSYTASRIASQTAASVDQTFFPGQSGGPPSSRGMSDIVVMPHSGHVIISQYFGSDASQSGAFIALDPTNGRVLATWQIPSVTVFGAPVLCHPRQLAADPSSSVGDERFVAIFDTFDSFGGTVAFPIQEFSYRADSAAIQPVSTAVRAAQDGSRMEMARFLLDGTLVVARTKANGLSAATCVAYRKSDGERRLAGFPPRYVDGLDTVWGSTCPPDVDVVGTDQGGLVRSLCVDERTGDVLMAGLDGTLQTVATRVRAGRPAWRVTARQDLELQLLRTPQRYTIGIRQGAIDLKRRLLWLPCNQLTLNELPWPIPPVALDQWVYAIPLDT